VLAVYVPRQDRAADYRRQAKEARAMAKWISLNDTKHHLLEVAAKHLEALAEIEEREARKVALIQSPQE
jgi:hypothetical protein